MNYKDTMDENHVRSAVDVARPHAATCSVVAMES
jgi:hypothetical protein